MPNIKEFVVQYDEILNRAKELLEIRQRILDDDSVVKEVDCLKPNAKEEVVMVSTLLDVVLHKTDGHVSCGSGWVSFHIPYSAFEDENLWIEELNRQKETLSVPLDPEKSDESLPDWLINVSDD